MQPGTFSLIFQGLKQDFSGNAKSSLAVLLRTTPERIEVLSKTPGRVIKSGLTREAAFRYQNAIAKAGGIAEIRDEDPSIAALEVNTSSLDFDLGNLSSIPTPIDPLQILDGPAPEPVPQRSKRGSVRLGVVAGAIVAGLVAVLYFVFPSVGPMFPSIHSGATPLEEILTLGARTQQQFNAYQTRGGTSHDGRWRGYLASDVEPLYGPDQTLKGYTIQLRKAMLPPHRLPSIADLQATLQHDCGKTWTGDDELMASQEDTACTITLGQQQIDVFVGSAK